MTSRIEKKLRKALTLVASLRGSAYTKERLVELVHQALLCSGRFRAVEMLTREIVDRENKFQRLLLQSGGCWHDEFTNTMHLYSGDGAAGQSLDPDKELVIGPGQIGGRTIGSTDIDT